jgi:RNA polymerase sigma factor (sigma-70 family)
MSKIENRYPVTEVSVLNPSIEETMSKYNIAEIIKDYGSKLRWYIKSKVKSDDDADDILQEVYYQLIEADRLSKPVESISGWLFTVARNRITDLYRRKKPGSMNEYVSDDAGELYGELGSLLFNEGSSPETEFLRSLVWEELDIALSELPEEQRFVFEQTEMKGISFKDLSEQTGVTVNTLISRKRYAVMYLRERLLYLHDELILF